MYIIDTNILAESNRFHFPHSKTPDFWDWLVFLGQKDIICIPETVYGEIGKGTDELPSWLECNKEVFFRPSIDAWPAMPDVLSSYVNIFGRGKTIPESLLETLQADPYVIAHAIAYRGTVVSNEIARNGKPNNYKEIRIPHVCRSLNTPCISLSQFLWQMRDRLP